MPSESKLKYKYGQLWVKDAFLLVFYIFLFDELENDSTDFIELKKELAQNIDNILQDMFGFLDFNEFINSDEAKKNLINHIENIIVKINEENNYFSLENLDEILLNVRVYHLKNIEYKPSNETMINQYENDLFKVKDNYLQEFREIKSLLEREYRI